MFENDICNKWFVTLVKFAISRKIKLKKIWGKIGVSAQQNLFTNPKKYYGKGRASLWKEINESMPVTKKRLPLPHPGKSFLALPV